MSDSEDEDHHRKQPRLDDYGEKKGAACVGYDVTVWYDQCDNRADLVKVLREYASKWVYQLEAREENRTLHWQIRLFLQKKRTFSMMCHLWPIPNSKISITSTGVHKAKSFNYVMKADTRVEGPFNEKDDKDDPPKLNPQLRRFMAHELRPWQQKVKSMITDVADDRGIICIVDEVGNTGKSIFAAYLEYQSLAYEIPFMINMDDIMQCVMGIKDQTCFVIDMPRGLRKDKLQSFYGGIECIKNGVAFDKRYQFRKKRFARPNVVIFTNQYPDVSLLSKDRWTILQMTCDYDVREFTDVEKAVNV